MVDPLKYFLYTMFYEVKDIDGIFNSKNIILNGIEDATRKYANLVTSELKKNTHYINDDKIELFAGIFCDEWSRDIGNNKSKQNLFYALLHYTSSCLRMLNGKPVVIFKELFRWNELSNKLGQDILLCSYMAYQNRCTNFEYEHKIPLNCGVDNKDLNYIYRKGMVELHQHLKASCDIFSLSWICLMNKVTRRFDSFKKLDYERCELLFNTFYQACSIRFNIFKYIQKEECDLNIKTDIDHSEILNKLNNLKSEIEIYNKFHTQKIGVDYYDYALKYNEYDEEDFTNIYSGEHFILYNAFKLIYRNPENIELTIALYKYLVAKIEIRRLLVQCNESVGFGNFKKFEEKKDIFLAGYNHYKKWCEILPLKEIKDIKNIKTIETRITPNDSYVKMMDFQRTFYQNNENNIDCYLIYHFIKEKDEKYKEYCERHRNLRRKIRRQTLGIASIYKHHIARLQTIGVDAANSELHCRPEVFAQAFRYLKKFSGHYYDVNTFQERPTQSLNFTFHAGEDFYDIADGLRSIDEAILFLQLSSGNRLGHCIALGQNTKLFYSTHNNSIIISKQYLIDNCVWLIKKSKNLNININPRLEEYLLSTFNRLCNELYGEYINIDTYLKSILLRSDNPIAISSNEESNSDIKTWNSYNYDTRPEFCQARKDKEAKEIYIKYHYDENVRCEGDKVEVFKVNCEYIKLIEDIQEAMMDEIERKEIVIECCPTSNFKIGTNKKYEDLPIFRFNNINNNRHNLLVTINTDDLGIFQTSLDNEFSLIALSALKKKDENGNLLYRNYQVYEWLDRIRENGIKYRFAADE